MSVNPRIRDVVRQEWAKRQPRRPKPNRDGFPKSVKQNISDRSCGMCELDLCGPAEHYHHRRPRGSGGTSLLWVNRAANSLHVASSCHDRIESNRTQAYRNGWLVSQLGTKQAADVPVLYRGMWVLLRDDGAITPIEGGAA